jgi:hypothetical protein
MKATPLAGLLAIISLVGVGCESTGSAGLSSTSGDLQPTGAAAVQNAGAIGFLVTNYPPLEQWMDERFKVRYENMPLGMVFEQQPISDIRYKMENLPQNTSVLNLVSSSISRREILKEISDFFNVDMTVEMVNGQPSHVIVRGRGTPSGSYTPPASMGTLSANQPAEFLSPDPALR